MKKGIIFLLYFIISLYNVALASDRVDSDTPSQMDGIIIWICIIGLAILLPFVGPYAISAVFKKDADPADRNMGCMLIGFAIIVIIFLLIKCS